MSVYTRLCSSLVFPLHERLKQHDSVARRRALEASQWWSPERIEALRLERLRAFLSDIGARVPYYRKLFAELDFRPGELRSLTELGRLPLLTNPLIRAHTDALKAEDAGPLKRFNTGGSSGEPLVFFMGLDRISHDVAAKWRATRWWDVDIGDPELVVWGSPIELGAQDRVRLVRDKLLRSELLPAFDMGNDALDRYIRHIQAVRPRMLFGYPSALSRIAARARDTGQRLSDLGIKVVFVTSERLYDEQRALIAAIYAAPVANGYGGRDAGFIAHECPAGGMHLSAEDILVELVDSEGRAVAPGEPGEVVVTHMATRDFPFVRYRTGDVATLATTPCACGRGLPRLEAIEGRTTDFITAADGTVMHGLALIYILRDLPGIRHFKIVQQSLTETEVLIVPDAGFGAEQSAAITQGFRARLGAGVRVQIREVDSIAPERSGKFRYVVSHV